jgi:hypothetical protein
VDKIAGEASRSLITSCSLRGTIPVLLLVLELIWSLIRCSSEVTSLPKFSPSSLSWFSVYVLTAAPAWRPQPCWHTLDDEPHEILENMPVCKKLVAILCHELPNLTWYPNSNVVSLLPSVATSRRARFCYMGHGFLSSIQYWEVIRIECHLVSVSKEYSTYLSYLWVVWVEFELSLSCSNWLIMSIYTYITHE